jgi:hypothetical protein
MDAEERAALDAAYRSTAYRAGKLTLRVGEPTPPALDLLLESRGLRAWAYLTAWNPGSRPLPLDENRRRQRELVAHLGDWQWLRGRAEADDGTWSEESLLVLGLPREDAMALGREFGQNAVLVGVPGGVAELVWL